MFISSPIGSSMLHIFGVNSYLSTVRPSKTWGNHFVAWTAMLFKFVRIKIDCIFNHKIKQTISYVKVQHSTASDVVFIRWTCDYLAIYCILQITGLHSEWPNPLSLFLISQQTRHYSRLFTSAIAHHSTANLAGKIGCCRQETLDVQLSHQACYPWC